MQVYDYAKDLSTDSGSQKLEEQSINIRYALILMQGLEQIKIHNIIMR